MSASASPTFLHSYGRYGEPERGGRHRIEKATALVLAEIVMLNVVTTFQNLKNPDTLLSKDCFLSLWE